MLDWIRFFVIGPGAPFTGYLALQIIAVLRLDGGWRIAALPPIPIMGWVVFSTADAYQQGSNLWPLGLILWGSVAFAYVALVLLTSTLHSRWRQRASSTPVDPE